MIIDKAGTPQSSINHRLLLFVWIDAKFQTFSDFQQSHLLLVKIIIMHLYFVMAIHLLLKKRESSR